MRSEGSAKSGLCKILHTTVRVLAFILNDLGYLESFEHRSDWCNIVALTTVLKIN